MLDQGELLQLASPEDVYRRPATSFVARFTGVAGELIGTVVRSVGETVEVRVGDQIVRARGLGHPVEGDAVRVVVRPAATSVTASAGAGAGAGLQAGVLSGVVTDVAYRGRGYDHVVTAGPWVLTAVHDGRAHPRGTVVEVALDPEHCIAFVDDEARRYNDELTAVRLQEPRDRVAPEMARRLP